MIRIINFNKTVLKNLNIVINDGITYIKGRNGAGKTTLLNCLAGLDNKYKGKIIGNDSIIYLNQNLYFEERLKVKDFAKFLLGVAGINNYEKHYFDFIAQYNNSFNFINFWDRELGTLSGGEKKIIYVSLIFSIDRNWYILDEPFASIDDESKKIIVNMIKTVLGNGKSVIITNHEKMELNCFENLYVIDLEKENSICIDNGMNIGKVNHVSYMKVIVLFILVIICVMCGKLKMQHNINKNNNIKHEKSIKWSDKVIEKEVKKQLTLENKQNVVDMSSLSIRNKILFSIDDLCYCKNLKELELVNCGIKDVNSLTSLRKIEKLDISNNEISDISCLEENKTLKKINILNTRINNIDSLVDVPMVVGRNCEFDLNIHYSREHNDYDEWYVWLWNNEIQGKLYKFDDNGVVNTKITTKLDSIGIVITKERFVEKDIDGDRYINIVNNQGNNRIDVYVDENKWDMNIIYNN